MVRGWRTTEFWGKVAVQAALIWNMVVHRFQVPDEVAWIIIGGLEGLYLMWRSALKARNPENR